MPDKTALLREVQIAFDAVRIGIETIANRPDTTAAMQHELALLQNLVDRTIEALETLQNALNAP